MAGCRPRRRAHGLGQELGEHGEPGPHSALAEVGRHRRDAGLGRLARVVDAPADAVAAAALQRHRQDERARSPGAALTAFCTVSGAHAVRQLEAESASGTGRDRGREARAPRRGAIPARAAHARRRSRARGPGRAWGPARGAASSPAAPGPRWRSGPAWPRGAGSLRAWACRQSAVRAWVGLRRGRRRRRRWPASVVVTAARRGPGRDGVARGAGDPWRKKYQAATVVSTTPATAATTIGTFDPPPALRGATRVGGRRGGGVAWPRCGTGAPTCRAGSSRPAARAGCWPRGSAWRRARPGPPATGRTTRARGSARERPGTRAAPEGRPCRSPPPRRPRSARARPSRAGGMMKVGSVGREVVRGVRDDHRLLVSRPAPARARPPRSPR